MNARELLRKWYDLAYIPKTRLSPFLLSRSRTYTAPPCHTQGALLGSSYHHHFYGEIVCATEMADLSTIEDCVVEIEGLLTDVTQRLAKVKKQKNVSPVKKSEDIGYMKNRMDRAKKSLKTMRVEIRELSKVEQKPHNDKAMQLEEKINQLVLDIEWFEKDEPGQPESCMLNTPNTTKPRIYDIRVMKILLVMSDQLDCSCGYWYDTTSMAYRLTLDLASVIVIICYHNSFHLEQFDRFFF